jgi:uncharacterized protein (DUF488 family)
VFFTGWKPVPHLLTECRATDEPTMHDVSLEPASTIWTIGHSNHPLETFLELLARQRIAALVDVRSSPYSRYASQFNREVIRPAVQQRGIEYCYLGDLLGGRSEDQRFYDDQGRVLYGKVAQSPGFRQGVEQLLDRLAQSRTAILCGEEDPTECHRRLLVGRVLRDRGVCVIHLRGDGRAQSETELAAEEKFRKTKGQMNLFETEEAAEWKSTQSVLPKRAPLSSSGPYAGPESGD